MSSADHELPPPPSGVTIKTIKRTSTLSPSTDYTSKIETLRTKMRELNLTVLCVRKEDLSFLLNLPMALSDCSPTLIVSRTEKSILIANYNDTTAIEMHTSISSWWACGVGVSMEEIVARAIESVVSRINVSDDGKVQVGFDTREVSVREWTLLQKILKPSISLVDSEGLVEQIRRAHSTAVLGNATALPLPKDVRAAWFLSDNASGIHPQVLRALQEGSQGFAQPYGFDQYTAAALDTLRRHFGADTSPFLLSNGTATNVLSVTSLLAPHQAVVCGDTGHMHQAECGAPERFSGCKVIGVPVQHPQGKLTPALLEAALPFFSIHPNKVQPGLISVAQPTEFGAIYSLQELRDLTTFAHERGFLFHVDGARLSNAVQRLGVSFRATTFDVGVDVVSLGGAKHGLENAEAVIFSKGCSATASEMAAAGTYFAPRGAASFPYTRKQAMQLSSKMRFVGIQMYSWLASDLWREVADHAHSCALRLQTAILDIPGVEVTRSVETNMLFFSCSGLSGPAAQEVLQRLKSEFSLLMSGTESGSVECRLVTSFSTTEAMIEDFSGTLRGIIESVGGLKE